MITKFLCGNCFQYCYRIAFYLYFYNFLFVIAQRTFFSIQMIGRAGALGSIIFSYKSFNFYALQ